jgi:hypothetical protein
MANPIKKALTNRVEKTISEWSKKPPQFAWYQDRSYNTDNFIYFDSLLTTAVAGGTQVLLSSGQPKAVDDDTIRCLDPKYDNQPMVYNNSNSYPKITNAANGGILYTGAKFGFASSDFVRVVVKVSVSTLLTLTIASSTGNQLSYTTPNAIPANVWTSIVVPVSSFTTTGTFVYTTGAKTIQITGVTAGTISLYTLETANNQFCFVGTPFQAQLDCGTAIMLEVKRKLEALQCYNFTDGNVMTEIDSEFKVTTKSKNAWLIQMFKAEVMKRETTTKQLEIATSTVLAYSTVSPAPSAIYTNYDVIATGVTGLLGKSVFLKFGETSLQPAQRIEEVTDFSTFFYDSTTGNIYLFKDEYIGRSPSRINAMSSGTATTHVQRDLNQPIYGSMTCGRITGSVDNELLAYKVQLMDIKPKQGKGHVDYEYSFKILPINDAGSYLFYKEIIS